MENQLFRKESLERISSPEQLHDYMRVTSPRMWMILSAIAALLIGFIVYASTVTMESSIDINVLADHGYFSSEVTLFQPEIIKPHMKVRLAGVEGEVEEIFLSPKLRIDLDGGDGTFPKDGNYYIELDDEKDIPEDIRDLSIYASVNNGIISIYDYNGVYYEYFSKERQVTMGGQKYIASGAEQYDATVITINMGDSAVALSDGAYSARIITESTKPISFLLN